MTPITATDERRLSLLAGRFAPEWARAASALGLPPARVFGLTLDLRSAGGRRLYAALVARHPAVFAAVEALRGRWVSTVLEPGGAIAILRGVDPGLALDYARLPPGRFLAFLVTSYAGRCVVGSFAVAALPDAAAVPTPSAN